MSTKGYLASGFKNVDDAEDLNTYSSCLTLLNSLEFFREYKTASFNLLELGPGLSVLEAGSGIGDDALKMAGMAAPGGKVVGIDKSAHMVKLARSKANSGNYNVEFLIGDVNNLDFEPSTFDRCRIDRTLQHLPDPARALEELFRVLKPGGTMLAFDNDWETYTLNSSNYTLVRKVCNYWCDSFSSGWIGRDLYGIFKRLGLKDIQVHPRTLVITELSAADRVFDIYTTVLRMEELEIISANESKVLMQELNDLDQSGAFFSSYTGFMVLGRKAG